MAKILLVEDNEMNRDMLSRRLERRGYEVVIAVDGAEGVDKAGTESPALILMDMSLPVVDGWEPRGGSRPRPPRARSPSSRSPRTPCRATGRRPLEAGCDDFDTKPVDLARLLGKIEALLARKPIP